MSPQELAAAAGPGLLAGQAAFMEHQLGQLLQKALLALAGRDRRLK